MRQLNPLGKLPTLVLEDGSTLFDSRVILEWLDAQAGGGRIIPTGKHHFEALRLQAIGDGMMDASVQQMSERRHHEGPALSQPWMDYQQDKVTRSLSFVMSHREMLSGAPHVGHIALACALAYLDYRFDGSWRPDHPGLVDWLGSFVATVPSFANSAHPA